MCETRCLRNRARDSHSSERSRAIRLSQMDIRTCLLLDTLYCVLDWISDFTDVTMALSTMRSKYLNDSMYIVPSTKKPGYVFKFNRKKDNVYRCCRCREFFVTFSLTLVQWTTLRQCRLLTWIELAIWL